MAAFDEIPGPFETRSKASFGFLGLFLGHVHLASHELPVERRAVFLDDAAEERAFVVACSAELLLKALFDRE